MLITSYSWSLEACSEACSFVCIPVPTVSTHPLIVNLSLYITEKECNGTDIHLTGGQTALDGIVEICEDEVWVPVCDDKWDYRAATVVCRQLGYYGGIYIQV